MLSTLQNKRLREGDRVVVATAKAEAEVIDSSDPGKVKIRRLDTGSVVWIGRKAILSLEPGNE